MKAVVFYEYGGPEVLRVEDLPQPQVGPDEALLRVRAVSVARTIDCEVRRRGANWPIPFPHVLGADPAGEVAAVGSEVRDVKPGDRVATMFVTWCGECEYCRQGFENACVKQQLIGVHTKGGNAEYVVVPARNLMPIPGELSFEEAAAAMQVFPTAWHLLVERGGVKAGETVLVMAAGGALGVAGTQIAKLRGARVIAAVGSDWKAALARENGADEVVNYRTTKLSDEVKRLTDGRGVDVVFENISSPELWPESVASLATRGRLLTCGSHGGGEVTLSIRPFYRRHLSVVTAAAAPKHTVEEVYGLLGSRKLRARIHKTFPLEQAREAHELVESREVFGRVVLTV